MARAVEDGYVFVTNDRTDFIVICILLAYAVPGMFMDAIGMLVLTLPVAFPAVVALGRSMRTSATSSGSPLEPGRVRALGSRRGLDVRADLVSVMWMHSGRVAARTSPA